MNSNKILVIGGNKDFNITRMAYFLREHNMPADIIRLQIGNPVDITLDMSNLELRINGHISNHKAIFYRQDTFESALNNNDTDLWDDSDTIFNTLRQYIILRNDIKIFSRHTLSNRINKIVNLHKAQEVGFEIPKTIFSSNLMDLKAFIHARPAIQKPIDGGSHTVECNKENLDKCRDDFSRLYCIQERLLQPEIRIYSVGDKIFPFQIIYDGIDYRKQDPKNIQVIPTEVPENIKQQYLALTKILKLDYSAGDFMTGDKGQLVFLEINNSPMFARADEELNGKICQAMLDFLMS